MPRDVPAGVLRKLFVPCFPFRNELAQITIFVFQLRSDREPLPCSIPLGGPVAASAEVPQNPVLIWKRAILDGPVLSVREPPRSQRCELFLGRGKRIESNDRCALAGLTAIGRKRSVTMIVS